MHLYTRYFNNKSPTPRGRRSPIHQPSYTTSNRPSSSAQPSHKYQSPFLKASPSVSSLKLLSLVNRFEALDILGLPDKDSLGEQIHLRPHYDSPIHDFEHNSIRKRLPTIFSPVGDIGDIGDGYPHALVEQGCFEEEDVFTFSSAKVIGTTALKTATRKAQGAAWSNNCNNQFQDISGGSSHALFRKERVVVPRAYLREGSPATRTSSIRHIINFFDGAASKGHNTQTMQSPDEPYTPTSHTGDDKSSLSNVRGITGIKYPSGQAAGPCTPLNPNLSSQRKRVCVLDSATPTRFLSRHSLAKSSSSNNISPYVSNSSPLSRARRIGSLFLRTPTGSRQLKNTEDVFGQGTQKATPLQRSRRRTNIAAKMEGDDSPAGLAKIQLSNKIAELYQAKSLERERADKQETAADGHEREISATSKPSNSALIGNKGTLRGNFQVRLETKTHPSKVADMAKLFEVRFKTSNSLVASKELRKVESATPVKSTSHNMSPSCNHENLQALASQGPSPPTPPPLPNFSSQRLMRVSPIAIREPDPQEPEVVSLAPTLAPLTADFQPCCKHEPTPKKQHLHLRSQIIQDRIKHFEPIKEGLKTSAELAKRKISYARKVRRSLYGIFEHAATLRRNGKEGALDAAAKKGLSTQDIEEIVNEVQGNTTGGAPTRRKTHRVTADKNSDKGVLRCKSDRVASTSMQEVVLSPDFVDSPISSTCTTTRKNRGSQRKENIFDEGFGEAMKPYVSPLHEMEVEYGKRFGRRSKISVGRRNTYAHANANGGDGTASMKGYSPTGTEDMSPLVIKEAECGLKHPKPLRVVEMKRMMLLCRERIGAVRDRERGKGGYSKSG